MRLDDWFLTADERGNPSTAIDDRHDGVAWTEGNDVDVLVDGRAYFFALHEALVSTRAGDQVWFTGLEGDADERLMDTDASAIGVVLCEAAARGVDVRGLVWRSHAVAYNEADNLLFTRAVNASGGQVLLDHRVRRWGSHHQKLVAVLRGATSDLDDVAFLGGIDLAHGRHDDPAHIGDPQAADLSHDNYGPTPPWHDIQVRLRGPAVRDVAYTFRERWDDSNALDARNPWRAALHRLAKRPAQPRALPAEGPASVGDGACAIQILRTYPERRRAYPFAPHGERSIARAYLKVFERARRLVYLEDQYLWSYDAAASLCTALQREPELLVVIVIPRYPDPDGHLAGGASAVGRQHVNDALVEAGGDRVAIYNLENVDGVPIYVHSKVCIVDDTWLAVGSDNVNRRSWTHDSEVSCAILDSRLDPRAPPLGSNEPDGARILPRATRLELAVEHGGLDADDAEAAVEPKVWFDMLRRRADALDAWHGRGRTGPRPAGHLRRHGREHVPQRGGSLLRWIHAHVLDPDGRPADLARSDSF